MTKPSEVRILTVPKWLLPAFLLLLTGVLSTIIFFNSEKWSFGNIFSFDTAIAQGTIDALEYVRGAEGTEYYLGPQLVSYTYLEGTRWWLNKDGQHEGFSYTDSHIRRHEDTSWVVGDAGDVHDATCEDGSRAGNAVIDRPVRDGEKAWDIGYNWIPRFIPASGTEFSGGGTLIAINAETGYQCSLSGDDNRFTGEIGGTVQISFYPSFTFDCDPSNPVTLLDIMEVKTISGAGTGDHIYYQKGVGMVAFRLINAEGVTTFYSLIGGCLNGEQVGQGDRYVARCVGSQLTQMVPSKREYGVESEIQLADGYGGVYGKISVDEVTVADIIQDPEVEREGDTAVGIPIAADFYNFRSMDLYYDLIADYPADGKFQTETLMAVMSWPNSPCVAGNANEIDRETLIPIPTGWDCTGSADPEYAWADKLTSYVEVTPEGGIAYTRKNVPMYFPLGTALGAIVNNPFNTILLYQQFSDFQEDEATQYTGFFVGDVSQHVNFTIEKWGIIGDIISAINRFLKIFGIEALIESAERLESTDGISVTMDGEDFPVVYAYTDDSQAGEQDIPLPDIDYYQDCDALEETWAVKYPELIDKLRGQYRSPPPGGILSAEDEKFNDKISAKIRRANQHRDKLKTLLAQCRGEGMRLMEIIGKIKYVQAPFIQILANYRLEDVILTKKPVCDPAEEGLYASKVTLNVKWYDKNAGGTGGGDYATCPTNNYLSNGSFESTGGSPGGTASGALPSGWTAMWKKSSESYCSSDPLSYCKAPEFKPIDASGDERRVLDGSLASLYFSAFNKHDVLMYQEVSVPAGQSLDLSGYAQLWRSSEETYDEQGCVISEHGQDGSFSRMCIVDTNKISLPGGQPEVAAGEWDRFVQDLEKHCTAEKRELDTWVQHYDSHTSSSGSVYVFLWGYANYANRNTDDYWDNVCLVPSGTLQTESLGEIQDRPRRGGTQSSDCTAVNWPEPSCEVSIEGGSSAPILDEDLIFYMPGLGAIPSLTARKSSGDAKSTNRAATDLNYCENRSLTDIPYNNEEYKCFSALDVYILQNLEDFLAERWAKAICPSVTDEAIEELRSEVPIEETAKFAQLWEQINAFNEEHLEGTSFDLTDD